MIFRDKRSGRSDWSIGNAGHAGKKIRIATNAQINRQRYSNADDVIDVLKRSARLLKSNDVGGSASASQLAKIKIGTGTDGKKEITSIQTAATVDNKGTELAIGTNVNQGSLKLGVEFKELTYAESSWIPKSKYSLMIKHRS